MHYNLPQQMIQRIEELVDASFSGRDELYAAAAVLDDDRRKNICRRLAEHLAGHATELQQILVASGVDSVNPLDIREVAEAFFKVAKLRDGDAGVLSLAENCERTVKDRFEEAVRTVDDDETAALLERHRDDIEFGEDVLRSIRQPPSQ